MAASSFPGGASRPRFAQATPPAIFPPVFGLFGLVLAWRRAGPAFAVPQAVADLLLGAVTLLFLFLCLAYGLKVARRPAVVGEDLTVLPGRAGLMGLALSWLLLAAAILPLSRPLALVALIVGIVVQGILVAMTTRRLLNAPPEARQINPVWHLVFVGFILIPLSGLSFAPRGLSVVIYWVTFAIAVAIYAGHIPNLIKGIAPPLRPLLAVHLAPLSLFGTVAVLLGWPSLAVAVGLVALALAVLLLVRVRYLTAAGFSPLWGAFTFPVAACAGMCLALVPVAGGLSGLFRIAGAGFLVLATLIVPVIAFKVLQAWARGGLSAKTNAAVA